MALDDLLQDLRYTVRTLRRDAGFTTFAVLIAGLGIGASATVFSVVHTLLLRPLPFAEPRQLVWIANRDTSGLSGQTTQVGHMLDLRERTQSLSAVAGYFAFYGVGDNLLSGSGEPERLSGVPVSDNFFDVLGVKPQIGRVFNAEECKWKGPKAVMLGHGLWQRRFNADPAIVGTALILNDEPHTGRGRAAGLVRLRVRVRARQPFRPLLPVPPQPGNESLGQHDGHDRPARSPESRSSRRGRKSGRIAGQIVAEHPERNGFQGNVKPLAEQVSGRVRLAVWVLAGAVGMVMLIVCANLSNLLLARTATRQKEVAIRTALGAGRRRLLAQLLTEGIVLSCSGALLGLLLAVAGTRALARLDAVSIPLLHDVQTDLTALALHPGDRDCDRDRVRARARAPAARHGADQRAQRRGAWLHRRAAARVDPQCARRGGGRLRLRPRRRRGPARSQPDPGARRGDGIPAVPGDDHPGRSRQPLLDA